MNADTNPKVGRLILEIVANQIRENYPPETRQTFEGLKREGYTSDEARRLIATAVTVEIFHMFRDHQSFQKDRFLRNLKRLPSEPWDENEG